MLKVFRLLCASYGQRFGLCCRPNACLPEPSCMCICGQVQQLSLCKAGKADMLSAAARPTWQVGMLKGMAWGEQC